MILYKRGLEVLNSRPLGQKGSNIMSRTSSTKSLLVVRQKLMNGFILYPLVIEEAILGVLFLI